MDGLTLILIWLASLYACIEVGRKKGRLGEGIALGILLGLIGLLIIAVLPPADGAPTEARYRGSASFAQAASREVRPTTPKGRLEALEELRRQGLVTDHEFAAKRADILRDV